ncbi:hypothetical protein GQX74_010930 [Glossina fuscipes]|nr:hypothetical protein GQX74_010930 [Glossina fuscipes]
MKSLTAEQSSGIHFRVGCFSMTQPFSAPLLLFKRKIIANLKMVRDALPIAGSSLRGSIAIVIHRIQEASLYSICAVFEKVECSIERIRSLWPSFLRMANMRPAAVQQCTVSSGNRFIILFASKY